MNPREALVDLIERLTETYRENGKADYDAGRVQGAREALDIFDSLFRPGAYPDYTSYTDKP